jgi:hypothetical protein
MMMSMRILNQRAITNGCAKTFLQQPQLQRSASAAAASTSASVVSSRATRLQQYTARCNYMSTQPCSSPEEDIVQMMLILGKPGGGKGTISEKLLKVCCCAECDIILVECLHNEFHSS